MVAQPFGCITGGESAEPAGEEASADDVEVDMVYFLRAVRAAIYGQPVTAYCDPLFFS